MHVMSHHCRSGTKAGHWTPHDFRAILGPDQAGGGRGGGGALHYGAKFLSMWENGFDWSAGRNFGDAVLSVPLLLLRYNSLIPIF